MPIQADQSLYQQVEHFLQNSRHHNQHTTCKVFVSSHEPSDRWKERGRPAGQYELSHDAVQVQVEESMQGSSCSITLVPRRPYHEFIVPGDWISVYFSTNYDAPNDFGVQSKAPYGPDRIGESVRVFFGWVRSTGRSKRVGQNGEVTIRSRITASGISSAFQETQIYYNEMLGGRSLFGALLPGLATLTKNIPLAGTPASIPRAIALAYLGFGGQFLTPTTYPKGSFASELGARERLVEFLKRSVQFEEVLGLNKVRLGQANQSQRKGLVARLQERAEKLSNGRSLSSWVDLFSYVEDYHVDGIIYNSPNNDLRGSVYNLMYDNSNPMMNEMFFSLCPPNEKGPYKNEVLAGKDRVDEWGQYPQMQPSMILREKPFGWTDDTYLIPSKDTTQKRRVQFGNVFLSSRGKPAPMLPLQKNVINDFSLFQQSAQQQGASFLSAQGPASQYAQYSSMVNTDSPRAPYRFLDRIHVHENDIIDEDLSLSTNDAFNFWVINQAKTPLIHQQYVLLQDGLIPAFLPESIARIGLRVQETTTKFLHTGGSKIDSKAAFDFLSRCVLAQDHWYQHSISYRSGTFTVPGMPKAHVGMGLTVTGSQPEVFYVEGVSHTWQINQTGAGRLATTMTVTRGMRLDEPFPYAPPDSVEIERLGRSVPRPAASVQPKIVQQGINFRNDAEVRRLFERVWGIPYEKETYAIDKAQARASNQRLEDYLFEITIQSTASAPFTESMRKTIRANRELREVNHPIENKKDRANAGRPPWLYSEDNKPSRMRSIARTLPQDDIEYEEAAIVEAIQNATGGGS